MPRRKRGYKGEGTVGFHKGTGLWYARVPFTNADGKQDRKVVYCDRDNNTEAAARQIRRELLRELEDHRGRLPSANKSLVEAFLKDWLDSKYGRVRPQTYADYKMIIETYIIPHLDHVKLGDFDEEQADKFLSKMIKKGFKGRRLQKVYVALHTAFERGLKMRKVARNPMAAIERPPYKAPIQKHLSDEQTVKLLAEARKREAKYLYPLLVLALDTGMRQGEILALEWDDIDIKAALLRVSRSLSYGHGDRSIQSTKTKAGLREVDLSATTVTALKEHQQTLFAQGLRASKLVFPNSAGEHMSPLTLRTTWLACIKEAGISCRFHDLRHTAATRLKERGVPDNVIAQRLGHASIAFTMTTYAHVTPKMRRDAADTFDDVMNTESKA